MKTETAEAIERDLTEALKVAGEAEKAMRNLIEASVSVAKRLDDDDECRCGMCEEIMFARQSLAALERIRNNKH